MDPSLRNWGFAHGTYDTETHLINIDTVALTTTEKTKHKSVRVNSDDLTAAAQLGLDAHKHMLWAEVTFVEVPVGSQSSRAMASYGVCVGVLGTLRAGRHNFIEVMPLEVKMATVGKKKASKQDIVDYMSNKYPNVEWPTKTLKGKTSIIMDKANHMADAIGAIEAGLLTSEFKQLLPHLKKL